MQKRWLEALIVALGLAVGGMFIGGGIAKGRTADRFVTVKGVSEREAKADLALWPIRFVAADNNLGLAQTKITESADKVRAFLTKYKIDASTVELHQYNVVDTQANQYSSRDSAVRFIIQQTIMVRSSNPDVVFEANQRVSELVTAGVVLNSSGEMGGGGPTYLFTKLNEIKPPMIAEATASAREAATQFAKDSGSALGAIRQATQGYFTILPRDQAPGIEESQQRQKVVRVVTTVEYYLN
ncbi:MAG TPA: SIMPL domain-containing protein [Vicinamibacterales bacterium]|nr:SIMPL domain-containing protein [Vicinamibacterales bacterium]